MSRFNYTSRQSLQAIVQEAIIQGAMIEGPNCVGDIYSGRNCPGGNYPEGAIILGTIIRVAIIQAQFTAGQLSLFKYVWPFGGQEALGGSFSFDFPLFDKGVDKIVNFCHYNG